jgi:hypothetical protein
MINFKANTSFNKPKLIGIIPASINIIHCILTPFIVALFPLLINANYNFSNYVFMIISLISLLLSCKSTKLYLTTLLIYFWLLLCFCIIYEDENIVFSILMYFSALGLIITHILNTKNFKQWHLEE